MNGRSRKLLNSQTPKLFGERLDAINIFRARKLPSWLFFLECILMVLIILKRDFNYAL